LDSSGRLIGVNTQIYSPSGASAGIGFSIPVDVVNWVVPDLIEFGEIKRPVLGVELVNNSTSKRMGIEGALILDLVPGGAASKAGFMPTRRSSAGEIELGDIIVRLGEEKISSNNDLILALEKYQAGDSVRDVILRNDEEINIDLNLDASR
jgi:S1-C subfamily serine protease